MRLVDYAKLSLALGPHRVARNVLHRARLRAGAYRRSAPSGPLPLIEDSIVSAVRNPFGAPAHLRVSEQTAAELRDSAERIVAGELQYFSHRWLPRPASWRVHPVTGYRTADLHWSECSEFAPGQGDVKWIWEASRFEWAYTLGRAWRANGDERAARAFWVLLESWLADNPPNFGINWRCAQECSLRLIALVWSASALHDSREATPARVRTLWSLVAALASRVQVSTGYAISQNNNHGLSEACALYLAGACLGGHRSSGVWRQHGRALFERQVLEQFARDGFYVQNSFNYTRLALRTCIVFMQTAALVGESPHADVTTRLRAAAGFLRAVVEPAGGRVPNFGANDGANVMSLSSAGYLDFRGIAQSVWFLLTGRKLYPAQLAADEELCWLGAGDAAVLEREPPIAAGHAAPDSGYFVLASGEARLHIRCATHKSRPGHADMLHADIWNGPVNIARDAGTYGYNDGDGWSGVLAGSAAHNVVVVDGQDQMRRLSRFLWAEWTRAQVLEAQAATAQGASFSGVHFGYRRLGVDHRRTVYGRNGDWLVLDDLLFTKKRPHELAVHWHLDAGLQWARDERGVHAGLADHSLSVDTLTEVQYEWYDRAEDLPCNGDSLYYGEITAGALFVVRANSEQSTRFVSCLGRERPRIAGGVATWHDLTVSMAPG